MLVIICVLFVAGVLIAAVLHGGKKDEPKNKGQRQPVSGKRVMTENEILLFEKMQKFLPNHIVFSQVAFSAFMTSSDFATRAKFNRSVADFVIINRFYEIAAIVELDDYSHAKKGKKDALRDELIQEAGYKVVRFKEQPSEIEMSSKLAFLQ